MKLRRTSYKDGNQLSRNILYLYVLACPWRSVPQYTVLTSESESNGQSLPVAVNARGQKYVRHQQKGELHTSDCGDDKSTQKFQPHFMNSKVFWRLVCTQNDSSSRVYSYNYLTYYNVFFMNCLTYTTISTTLL